MLFDLLIGGLEMLADTIEYGPAKAFEINTSVCPEGERAFLEIEKELKKEQSKISVYDSAVRTEKKNTGMEAIKAGGGNGGQRTSQDCKNVIDEDEEEIISKAVTEKGCW